MNATAQSLVVSSSHGNSPVIDESHHIDFSAEEALRRTQFEDVKDHTLSRLRGYQPYGGIAEVETDRLADRYTIHVTQLLPEHSYGNVQAFAVTDDGNPQLPLYAVVCHPAYPFRDDIFRHIRMEHPNLLRFYDEGIVHISSLGDQRHVFIFERPKGKRLSELIERHQGFPDEVVIHQIIKPIASVLTLFYDRRIAHCRIHPDNIFIGDRTVLGECIGEPAGYSQEYLYEPPERIDALPEGKGSGSIRTDVYALGVLTLELLFGMEQFRRLGKDNFINRLMSMGGYALFTSNRHMSEAINDFARGTLNDVLSDRWTPTHVDSWINGKRYNILQPSLLHEASRGYEFDGQEYHSGRALAHAFFQKWHSARNAVRSPMLTRWIEQNMHKKELSLKLRHAVESSGGEHNTSAKQNDELLARAILLLDPFGPIRIGNLAFHIDGIGSILCEASRNNRQQDIQRILECFYIDLPNFASEVQNSAGGDDSFDALFKIDKIRHRVRTNTLGFGMERAIYDLNPGLPCLSPKLKEYRVVDNQQLLYALDKIATHDAHNTSLIDTHIAAFAASQSNLNKDISFNEFSRFHYIKDNKELIIIAILAKAQEKTRIKSLFGLAHWAAYRLIITTDQIHSLKIRRTVCDALLQAAERGNLSMIVTAYLNKQMLDKDIIGYKQSTQLFHTNTVRIHKLRSYEHKRRQATELGSGIATMFSILILIITFYVVIKNHLIM